MSTERIRSTFLFFANATISRGVGFAGVLVTMRMSGSLATFFGGGVGARYPSGIRNQNPDSACQRVEASHMPNGKIATFSFFGKQISYVFEVKNGQRSGCTAQYVFVTSGATAATARTGRSQRAHPRREAVQSAGFGGQPSN